MLKRKPDWPEALAGEIQRVLLEPFTWGVNDCCLFACNCVWAMTSTDVAAGFRGYESKREALAVLKDYGGVHGVAESVARQYGIRAIPVARARRGDVLLLDAGLGETLGICGGDRIMCPGADGLVSFPLSQGIYAWEIG